MKPQSETRKLAAVMFADIEGYTSLFQQDENAAIQQVGDHRKDLEGIIRNHRGEIIQFYGDGSVTVFDSVVSAIRSAMEIQQASVLHRIPVRIGIHMGDLIYKDGDIFGDVVNIASRIQATGIPGSIVVSRKVVDELNNHPEIHLQRLGLYALKNVKERMELFALTNRGLSVPPPLPAPSIHKSHRSLYLLYGFVGILITVALVYAFFLNPGKNRFVEERIIIPSFKDHTLKPEYQHIGDLASSYITKVLRETSEADAVSYESILLFTNTNLASITNNPTLARRTGAMFVLQGNYTLTGEQKDSLVFWAGILDLRTKEPYPVSIPNVYCSAANDWDCIQKMSNIVAGYWRSKDDHVFSPTNNKAYSAYLQAQKLWADPDKEQEAKGYLLQAIGYDSTFLDAWFLLLDGFSNADEYQQAADTIALIKSRFSNLNARQENYLRYYEEDMRGHTIAAFQYLMKALESDPKDLFLNTTAMVLAVEFLNDPMTALQLHKEIELDSLDLNTCVYCRTRANMAMQAYADISDVKNAGLLAARLKPYAEKRGQITRLIRFYLSTGDTATVNELIRHSPKKDPAPDIRQFYYTMAAQYAMLNGDWQLRDHYAGKALELYGQTVSWRAARCHALRGDLSLAENIYLESIRANPSFQWHYGNLGILYARQGDHQKANDIILTLDSLRQPFDFGTTAYLQGRIKAHLGLTEEGIKYLHTALDEGITFRVASTFQHDPDLIILHDEPAYLKLLARNRQKL